MLELDPDLKLDPDLEEDEDRPLEDSLGDTSRDPLLLQMMSCMILLNGKTLTFTLLFAETCMCCDMRSMATVFSAPRGTITSAYFFVGRQNSSKAGFTRVVYWE